MSKYQKILFSFLIFFAVTTPSFGQDVRALLEQAFLSKNKTGLEKILAENFSIAGNTNESAQSRLEQILTKYSVKSIQQLPTTSKAESKQLNFIFHKNDGKSDSSILHLNPEGKIKHIDLFDRLYGMTRLPKANLRASIPFENHAGAIILKVYINNHPNPLKLLFDTGADGMAINEGLAKTLRLNITRTNNASVVGGNQEIQVSDQNKVRIADLEMDDMSIAIFPSHDEKNTDGIIGNSLLKRFITEINYDENKINLYDFGAIEYPKNGKLVPISLPSSLIEIPATLELLEGKKAEGQFIFDTGASYSLICFRPFVLKNRLLVSGFKPDGQTNTLSFGINTPTFYGKAAAFHLNGLAPSENMPVSLMAGSSSNQNWSPPESGSIGNRFISRYNLWINIADSEIHFSPNKLHDLPFDFLIRSTVLGWNQKAELQVLTDPARPDIHEKIGLPIKEIMGIPTGQLIQKKESLQSLLDKAKNETITILFQDGSTIKI
ncbi:retropepsin-like aspartic protease [Sphingobacterium cellulitidis]|uniref:retropepsin-like aspartic protease n=1 Tax=Sphingobacterium cellulitidis TaxID=1768011 RepID=UPI00370DD88E